VLLGALLIADPRALRGRWPYLGGLLALLVFLPNILWNADNDWLTMRFQFGHGFLSIPDEVCHRFHSKAAIRSTASLPLIPRERCHRFR
jgi:hypothetical protein